MASVITAGNDVDFLRQNALKYASRVSRNEQQEKLDFVSKYISKKFKECSSDSQFRISVSRAKDGDIHLSASFLPKDDLDESMKVAEKIAGFLNGVFKSKNIEKFIPYDMDKPVFIKGKIGDIMSQIKRNDKAGFASLQKGVVASASTQRS